ncbi:MAG: hypothetical protein JXO49_03205 [Deltaproteobacteria bacterium]|nr:hypothetical protein [Candidatus Anaeroferrophillus wilburensis]MBN2888336.1 hypothetical protein [Deltaproteobacteria bacterium]
MKIDFSFFKFLPTWLKTSLVLAVLMVGVVVFFAISRVSNTHESLCQSCHPVIYRQWHEAKFHPQTVTCYECHSQHRGAFPAPDDTLFNHYRSLVIPEKFLASQQRIHDNCLRCHAEIPQLNEVKKTRIVKISHKKHFKGEKVKIDNCLACHVSVTHDKFSIETNRPRMHGCFTGECHLADRRDDKCELCHFVKLVDEQKDLEKADTK